MSLTIWWVSVSWIIFFYLGENFYRNFNRISLEMAFPKSVTQIIQRVLNRFFQNFPGFS